MIPKLPSAAQQNEWLNAIFMQAKLGKEDEYYANAITAFENLTGLFFQIRLAGTQKLFLNVLKNIRIDYVGLTSMLKRFQRDAHGVRRFHEIAEMMVKAGHFDSNCKDKILEEVGGLGLRITADSPRKTREAAVFSLWMCVFRPITFDSKKLPEVTPENLELCCAMVNFFIASSYLEKFGDIELGQSPREIEIRTTRIKHDFTCREVSLSTLETFYGAIFRILPEFIQHENKTVKTSSFKKKK